MHCCVVNVVLPLNLHVLAAVLAVVGKPLGGGGGPVATGFTKSLAEVPAPLQMSGQGSEAPVQTVPPPPSERRGLTLDNFITVIVRRSFFVA